MTDEQRKIAEALRKHGALNALAIRRVCRLSRVPSASIRALEDRGIIRRANQLDPTIYEVTPKGTAALTAP